LEWNQLSHCPLVYLTMKTKIGLFEDIIWYALGYNVKEQERNISSGQHNNTSFNHLPKERSKSDVNNPISLGMEPISLLSASVFGYRM